MFTKTTCRPATRRVARSFRRWTTAAALLLSSVAASGDGFLTRVNEPFRDVRDVQRTDIEILTALAALDPAPGLVPEGDALSNLLTLSAGAGSPGWSALEAWAQQPAQVAALDALRRMTPLERTRVRMVFAQPYGAEGVPIELISAGLYTELGDPPLLAGAEHGYLDAVRTLTFLAHVEASRLEAAGSPRAAIDLLLHSGAFGRQFMDRSFSAEWREGWSIAVAALNRVRDVVYTDWTGPRRLTAEDTSDIAAALAADGPMHLERLRPPGGDLLAAEQVIALTLGQGGVNERTFAPTLARLGASGRPLRLFGEAGRFQSPDDQASASEATALVRGVFAELNRRWGLQAGNAQLRRAFDASSIESGSMLAAQTALASRGWSAGGLMRARSILETEVVGTRQAVAVVGYTLAFGALPPHISAIRPRWVRTVEADPFNQDRDRVVEPPMEFFVPIRDYRGDDPHEIIGRGFGGTAFVVTLFDDAFVLYSVGPDGNRDYAEQVRAEATGEWDNDDDYLIWPPVLSLSKAAAGG